MGRMPAADLAAIALSIRRAWLGDTIRTEGFCADPPCHEPMDIAFGISAYLDTTGRGPAGARPGPRAGWFELAGGGV